jgi:hypothetical protein
VRDGIKSENMHTQSREENIRVSEEITYYQSKWKDLNKFYEYEELWR